VATNGNNFVIAEGTTKHVSFDNPVSDDRVIDEFLIDLIRLDRQISLAAFLVAIDVEKSLEVLAFLNDAGVAYGPVFRACIV